MSVPNFYDTPELDENGLPCQTATLADVHAAFTDWLGDDYDTEDGTNVRDYVHVGDIAAAHVVACELGCCAQPPPGEEGGGQGPAQAAAQPDQRRLPRRACRLDGAGARRGRDVPRHRAGRQGT